MSTTPTGTLMKNAQRQPGPAASSPLRDDADRAGQAADGAEDAERAVTLAALGEGDGQQRQADGHDQRGAESLDGAGGDQHAGVLRDHRPGTTRR